MAKSILVEILGNATGFAAEMDKAAGKTRAFGKAAGVAGLAIAGGLAYGLEKSVKAAGEAQVSTTRMDEAFKASGQSASAFAGQIAKAEDSSRKLGFSNMDVRNSLGSLEIATHSGTASIKDLGTAEDLARFKHINLSDASKMLTTAMAGSTRAVHQLGINIIPVTSATDKVNAAFTVHAGKAYEAAKATAELSDKQATAREIIAAVGDKVHGQAAAFAGTAQGGMAQFGAQTEAIEENLGSALLPALGGLSQKLADATGWLSKHTTIAKIAVGVLGGLAGTLMAVSAASKLSAAATTIAKTAMSLFTTATEEEDAALTANPIGIVVVALAALGTALYEAWEHSQTFRTIVLGVWKDVKTATTTFTDFFTQSVPQAFDTVKGKIEHAFTEVENWVSGHWPAIATLISGPFAPLISVATNAFGIRSKLETAFGDIKSFAGQIWGKIAGAVSTAAGLFVSGIQPIITVVKTVIGWLKQLWSWASKASGILGKIGGLAGKIGGLASHIPHLAAGGVVTSPTFAMIGEAGPEAVVPLTGNGRVRPLRGAGGGGGGVVVNVNLNGPVFGDKAQVAREIGQELALQLRGGRVPALISAMSHTAYNPS